MSEQLARVLLRLQVERKTDALKSGSAETLAWIFCTEAGTPLNESRIRKVMRKVFASLLLQQGESPAYVQRQLGHASIKLTADTYGKGLPMGNKAKR